MPNPTAALSTRNDFSSGLQYAGMGRGRRLQQGATEINNTAESVAGAPRPQARITGHIGGEDGGETAGRGHGWVGHPVPSFGSVNCSTTRASRHGA